MGGSDAFYRAAERRIEYLTLGFGAAAAAAAAFLRDGGTALGVAMGAVLAWVNYRWLKQGVATLVRLAVAQADAEKTRVPASVYAKFFGRYALLIAVIYVIFTRSLLPLGAVLAGLSVLVAAVVVEILFELFSGGG